MICIFDYYTYKKYKNMKTFRTPQETLNLLIRGILEENKWRCLHNTFYNAQSLEFNNGDDSGITIDIYQSCRVAGVLEDYDDYYHALENKITQGILQGALDALNNDAHEAHTWVLVEQTSLYMTLRRAPGNSIVTIQFNDHSFQLTTQITCL